MDYRALMMRYMKAIRDIEGVDFIEHLDGPDVEIDFAEDELEELQSISDESLAMDVR